MAPALVSRPAFARIAPFALFIAFVAAQSLVGSSVDETTQRWLTIVRGLAVAAALAYFWRSYSELRDPLPGPLRSTLPQRVPGERGNFILAIVVGLAVFAVWITFDSGWAAFEEPARGFAPLRGDGTIDWLGALLRLFGLVAVVPIMEELFWRSFLMRWIDSRSFLAADPRRASLLAFVLSCALFSIEHSLWFAGLVAGAAYGWLYIRSGNLWIPITSHAVTNGALGTWILATGNWRFW